MRAESATMTHLPRTLPAWRAPEPGTRPRARRRPTATSNFGAGRRESHDATAFYERFEAPTLSGDDAVVAPYEIAEPFVNGDARHMDAVVDGSVALVVTSPPYFAGKQYEEELERDGIPSSYVEYLAAAHRRVRRVRAQARTGRPHRGERREPRPQAVPQPRGRRHPHPAGRPEAAAARRGHLAQGRGRGRQLRVGLVPQRGEPGAARHDRARRDREQGPLRPRAEPRRPRAPRACRRRTRSTPTSSWPPRSTCGTSRPRARAASRTRRRSRSSCPSG